MQLDCFGHQVPKFECPSTLPCTRLTLPSPLGQTMFRTTSLNAGPTGEWKQWKQIDISAFLFKVQACRKLSRCAYFRSILEIPRGKVLTDRNLWLDYRLSTIVTPPFFSHRTPSVGDV